MPSASPTAATSPTTVAAAADTSVATPATTEPVAASTPTPLTSTGTDASSGTTVGNAGQSQTVHGNVQVSGASAGGGKGPVSARNSNVVGVVDAGGASSQSGVAVVLAPTAAPGASAAPTSSSLVTAASGNAVAQGVTAQNTVNNVGVGVVGVVGANQSTVSVQSNTTVGVQDVGAANARSGEAWSASGTPVPAAVAGSPVPAGAPAVSSASTATGYAPQTSLANTLESSQTVAGAAATAVTVVQNQQATINTQAGAAAWSGAACAAPCAQPAAGAGAAAATPGNAQAATGAANAQGLVAQNTVNTTAQANVHVGGQNFAPIQVVIDAVTYIFNGGSASAASGTAVAGSGAGAAQASGAAATPASSGAAEATGAQVTNKVDLRSTASVHVTGNNYNPINLILNMAVQLVSQGMGVARSGDAQAGMGANGAGANSGSAHATGLQVLNLVNLFATANVDVDGNNYAPISVYINFNTNIQNEGRAVAVSGAAHAGSGAGTGSGGSGSSGAGSSSGGGSPQSSGSGSGSATSSGSGSGSIGAASGAAIAVSHSDNVTINSAQVANANGSGHPNLPAASSSAPAPLLNQGWDPQTGRPISSSGTTPLSIPGLNSLSGDAIGTGMSTTVVENNVQITRCADPGVSCTATNNAAVAVVQHDTRSAPPAGGPNDGSGSAPGSDSSSNQPMGVSAGSGSAFVDATPTPKTKPASNGSGYGDASQGQSTNSRNSGGGNGGGGGGGSGSDGSGIDYAARIYGHTVNVNPWDRLPGRRLPPMPRQKRRAPATGLTVRVGQQTGWPGVEELPLPDQDTGQVAAEVPMQDAAPATSGATRSVTGGSSSARGDSGRAPSAVAAQAGDDLPPLPLVDVDPWSQFPGAERLPMPNQAARATLASAPTQADGAAQDGAGLASQPPAGPSAPAANFLGILLTLLGVVVAVGGSVLGGTPQGRLWFSTQLAALIGLLQSGQGRILSGGGWVAARGLGLLATPRRMAASLRFGRTWLAHQGIRTLAILRLTLGLLRIW